MTPKWFYLKVKDIAHLFGPTAILGVCIPAFGNAKVKITKSWGTAEGLKNYLRNNRKIVPKEYKSVKDFENGVKNGKVKTGAVVIQCYKKKSKNNAAGEGHHAVMIGNIYKNSGKAYFYAHTNSRGARSRKGNDECVSRLIDQKYKILVLNIK